jgi:hypothetical protein
MEMTEPRTFLELPYHDRRLIVVGNRSNDVGSILVNSAIGSAGVGISLSFPLVGIPIAAFGFARNYQQVKEALALRQILIFVDQDITELLSFPPGHPQRNVVYVGHPFVPRVYFPINKFHPSIVDDKAAESLSLLTELGASDITIELLRGHVRFGKAMFLKADPLESTQVGGEVRAEEGHHVVFRAKLNPRGRPKPDLKNLAWLPHEPYWQELARARMKGGLTDFSLKVDHSDDFGVNAALKQRILKIKLDLGGEFQSHERTTFQIEGRFPELRSRWWRI